MKAQDLEDRISLKELVDTISILGDKKDFNAQVQLFSEDAVSETFAAGKPILKLTGRSEMAEAFGNFLRDFETVYHFNGQQVVTLDGDCATGTVYCLVTLIGDEKGTKMTSTIGVIYEDQYVRGDHGWLVAKRTGHFNWQEKREVIL
jgi:ketosteroid isomerase-like protein